VASRGDKERWAFAFSAKQKWQEKLEDDVEKIIKTRRAYKQIYFITNQFVKDKKRAEVEDELTKRIGVPVHIMDRSWIMKCVFENRLAHIAVETLHMTGYENAVRKEVGPNDARREAELKQLDEEIADPDRYQGSPYQLGEDCLRSALLARGLERSRIEIDGRFARAEQVARKINHTQQRLRIVYNKAWTAFWWFEDFDLLNRLYDEVEALALTTEQADDLELLANLRTILKTSIASGSLDTNAAKFEERNAKLRKELSRLAKDAARPNNALWARTQILLMDLQDSLGAPDQLSKVLSEFTDVVDSAKGLISYPIEPVTKILRELGSVVTDDPRYDALLERVVKIMQERTSKGEVGRILLERGFQKLRGKRPYDAIVLFGRAQQLLALREYRGELIAALLGAGLAYEAVGLLWAARANTLAAANQAASDYIEEGTVTTLFLSCLQKMVWLELQLGRIPATLQWIDVTSTVAQHLALSGEDKDKYLEQREMQDGVLAILILKTEIFTLKWLDRLPSMLEERGLFGSWMALLYGLGHEEHLRSEGAIPENATTEEVREFFTEWSNQPVSADLPDSPELYVESQITLRSSVLGLTLLAKAGNNLSSISLAERILASLEALLATSLEGAIPHVEEFTIILKASDFVGGRPEYEFDDAGQSVTVTHSTMSDNSEASSDDGSWLQDLLLQILGRIVMIEDLESYGKRVFDEESGLARAINFSNPAIPISNIVGPAAKFKISDWEAPANQPAFRIKRNAPWNVDAPTRIDELSKSKLQPGEGEPPKELLDTSNLKHKDRKVLSLINIPLWNRAEWSGTIYAFVPNSEQPPIVGLAFKDASAGKSIFEAWRSKLGRIDDEERLRISIIKGIDAADPHGYRVVTAVGDIRQMWITADSRLSRRSRPRGANGWNPSASTSLTARSINSPWSKPRNWIR
jgi:hypothetical protein